MNYSQMDQATSTSIVSSRPSELQRRSISKSRYNVATIYTPSKRFSRYDLKSFLPIRLNPGTDELSVQNAGLFSFITFGWVWKYLWANWKEDISFPIPVCPKADSCRVNAPRLTGILNDQITLEGRSLSMTKVVWKFVRTRMIFTCILYIFASILSMFGVVFFIPKILSTNDNDSLHYVTGFVCTEFCSCFFFAWSNAINIRTAIRLRSACFSSLFKHAMLTSVTFKLSSWQLVSFLDGQNIHELVMSIPYLICTPFVFLCCMIFVGLQLQLWGYMSVVIIFLFFPIFIIVAFLSKNLLHRASLFSDERLKLLEDFIINNIYVKFFNQEESFRTNIACKRENEMKNMKRAGLYDNFCYSFIQSQPLLSITALFLAYQYQSVDKRSEEISAVCIILLIHMKQWLDNFWYGINNFIKGLAALNKYKKIMTLETIRSEGTFRPIDREYSIFIKEANFQRTKQEILDTKSILKYSSQNKDFTLPTKQQPIHDVLCDINMFINKGSLIGICGLPGSGKSSLLLAIMGLLLKSAKGKRFIDGTYAYVSQQPTIFNESLKDNIIFGNEVDSTRYYRTTMHCGLTEYISQLPQNDDTIIESQLLSLELRQRIALARAMYADRDIYLLDNPLSSLEYNKSLQIFDNCILKSLQEKTIVLVTDQIQFLQHCDEVYMLKDGEILLHGPHSDMLEYETSYKEFNEYLMKQSSACRDKSNFFETSAAIPSQIPKDTRLQHFPSSYKLFSSTESLDRDHSSLKNEIDNNGDSSQEVYEKSVFISFTSYFGNIGSIILLLLAQIVNAAFISFLPIYFIISLQNSESSLIYLGTYFGIFVVMLVMGLIMNYFYNKKMFAMSMVIHNEIVEILYKASLSFFKSTSLRIISTFSLHLRLTDDEIPRLMHNILLNIFLVIMSVGVIFFVSPWFIIPVGLILIISALFTIYVRKALLNFNVFNMDYTDLLYNQVVTMLTARPVIQAYEKTDKFTKKLYKTYDEYITYTYIIYAAKGLLSFLLQLLSVILLATVGYWALELKSTYTFCVLWNMPVLHENKNASLATISCLALAILCVLQMGFAKQRTLLLSIDASMAFDMLRRVQEFKMIMKEESHENEIDDEKDSKQFGNGVWFCNVALSTENSTSSVLNGISFQISAEEKAGFVGLTSSERKGIIAVLYKLVNSYEGNVILGEQVLCLIPVLKLRRAISIIPSEPHLFKLTIREMLNPADKLTSDEMEQTLRKFSLWEKICRLPNKIDSIIEDYFKCDEKQFLCLVRAYLKQNPILVIEDFVYGSDLHYVLDLQSRNFFPNTTVLIFANDVNSLRFCDRIAVVNNGKVSQIDDANNIITLLNNQVQMPVITSTLEGIPETSF